MADFVCLDASFALLLVLQQNGSVEARTIWRHWTLSGVERVSAPLFFAEITSVLRAHVYFERITQSRGEAAFQEFLDLGVSSVASLDLQPRAWTLAKQYSLSRAYDAQYLAVATALGCELWTADLRLANNVRQPWVRTVGGNGPTSAP